MVDYVADFTLEEQPEIEADFSIEVSNTDHNTLLNRDLPNQHPISAITGLDSALNGKQDVLTAGDGISIENGVISATVQSAVWGNITGTLSDQTDLKNALDGKLDSSALDGYATENWVTNQGYLTQIVSADVTSALGYTPYNSTNPSGYQTASQVATAVATETNARELADNGLQAQIDAITSASDVTDIVGTYAELQAYDTSTLPNNSIIKVLQDESRDDETTYYRWVITGGVGAWVLIGEEGPYYTKSQADSTFVPQTITINGKALSSDITLTASDVGALPSGTTIGDGTLTIQVNSTDLQTFTANQTGNVTANIVVPTDTSDLTNTAGFITSSALSDYVTKDTNQEITGEKTFKGQKRIIFKQSTSTDKLGFTLKDNSNNERGYLEYNPSNTIDGANVFTLGSYSTNVSYRSIVGFRYYDGANSAAYNLLAPLAGNAKSSFSLTTTYTNFYLPLGFTNGTSTVLTANTGVVNISSITVQNTATSSNSVTLFGTANTTSYYVNSINIGFQSVANGGNGTAVGYNSNTTYYGAALGSGASASGQASVAIGYGATASGISSIQIGNGTNAEKNTLYVGFYNSGSNMNYKLLGSDGKIPSARLPIATSVSSSSTNDEVVGAKLFYDTCGDIETLINAL